MRGQIAKLFLSAFILAVLCAVMGCGGGGDNEPPVADITGNWDGEAKDPEVSGNYWYPIEFIFRQDGNAVEGISSFPGLARFKGHIDGEVLTIDGTDIYAYILVEAGKATRIQGTYTSSGGLTAPFWLEKATD